MSIEKNYHPEAIEKKWYTEWEAKNYFAPTGSYDAYCIMLPPPNVTGSLHMGHGFGFTLIDVLIRYQRMCGKNTLWQTGTDHAGIATQIVVEKQINLENKTRHDLGRDAFVAKIWEWKDTSGGNIMHQLRRLGASMDWQRERFTLDEELSYAVREVFIKLYKENLIYKGVKLVNWDPALHTAISDLEVISQEEAGQLWHIRYPIANSKEFLVVATTRPETLLGDVAVAVHPEDTRYQHLIGKNVQLPLTERTIPIIADEYVDPTFGSGCVKITPAHDFNDYEVGKRHQLSPINIFTISAHLNENVPLPYQGLERFIAREKIVADLQSQNLIEKIVPHQLNVPRGEKSGVVIEPYLTQQWFMKMKPLAEPAIEVVKNGSIKFIPENWEKIYFQWMNNIEDWCISRQLWWGHRLPVWYDHNGKTYVGHSEVDVRQTYQLSADITLEQDADVLDTWFSSALWPFSTLGWPKKTIELDTFFPTDVLVTGFDIIFFWVARMIMLSLKFTGKIPFKEVYITGLIRDAEGHKMSKSKGNVLDPLDLIDGITLENLIKKRTLHLMQPKMAEKIAKATRKEFPQGIAAFGTDALRFTFCTMASFSREIRFDMNRLISYHHFCNKLWNAARYVLMNVENYNIKNNNRVLSKLAPARKVGGEPEHRTEVYTLVHEDSSTGSTNKFSAGVEFGKNSNEMIFSLADRWILTKLQLVIAKTHTAIQEYRFDQLAQNLYDFTWNEFCDWYLELSKPILTATDSNPAQLQGTRYTLLTVLETLLRLLHPIMPFITEDIWQRVAPLTQQTSVTIMLANYPQVDPALEDKIAFNKLERLKEMIVAIRTIRSESNIPPNKKLSILFKNANDFDHTLINENQLLLQFLAKLTYIRWLNDNENIPPSATAYLGQLEIHIPMEDFINKEEELARLEKELTKLEKERDLLHIKLQNPTFTQKAPTQVVQKEKDRYAELNMNIEKIKAKLKIDRLGN